MNLLLVALRYLQQRKARTALTTLAIVFGVAVIYGTNALFPTMTTALEHATVSPDNPNISLVPGFNVTATDFDADTILPKLAQVTGITSVKGGVTNSRVLNLPDVSAEMQPFANLKGVDPADDYAALYPVEQGRFLQADERDSIVISSFLAGLTGLKVGDYIPLFGDGVNYEIVGMMPFSDTTPDVILPLAQAQAAFDMNGLLNQITLTISQDVTAPILMQRLDEVFGKRNYRIENGVDLENANLNNLFYVVIFNIFGGLALFTGAFLIYITFAAAVIERKRDLAMMRAIGGERGQVVRLMLVEALIQGVIGTVVGLLVGQVFALVMLRSLWETTYRYFTPPAGIPINPLALVMAVGFGMGTTLIAGYLPAQSAGQLSPLEAMRPSSEIPTRRVALIRIIAGSLMWALALGLVSLKRDISVFGAIPLLIGTVMLVPVLIPPLMRLLMPLLYGIFPRVADAIYVSLQRQPWRTAATVNLMVIGFTVFTGVMGLFTPLLADISKVINANAPDTDFTLYGMNITGDGLGIDNGEQLVEQVKALPNVAGVTTTTLSETEFNGRMIGVLGVDPSVGTRMRYFGILEPQQSDSSSTFLSAEESDTLVRQLADGNSAIISQWLSVAAGLHTGDTITLSTAEGQKTYTILAIAYEYFPDYRDMGVVIAQSSQDFPTAEITSVSIGLADLSQKHLTLEQLTLDILPKYPQLFLDDMDTNRNEMIANSERGISVFYVMAVIVLVPSILGLLNTLAMSVLERTREIGVMRATGASKHQMRRMIVGEGLFLGVLSAVIGVVVGMGMAFVLITAMNGVSLANDQEGYQLSIPIVGFGLALVAGLGLITLATLLPANRAARLDVIEALRYE